MNLLTPLAGFLIGYGGIMGYQVIDSTYKGEMPGPKSFGYFIGGMTLLSAATIYALGRTDKVFNAEGDSTYCKTYTSRSEFPGLHEGSDAMRFITYLEQLDVDGHTITVKNISAETKSDPNPIFDETWITFTICSEFEGSLKFWRKLLMKDLDAIADGKGKYDDLHRCIQTMAEGNEPSENWSMSAEGLSQFTPNELTQSSAIHGDFDHASLNYSGHQNMILRADGNYNDFIEDMEGVMGKYGEMKDFDSGYNPQNNLLKARMVVEVDDEDFGDVDFDAEEYPQEFLDEFYDFDSNPTADTQDEETIAIAYQAWLYNKENDSFDAEMMMPEKQCVICGGPYTGYGHNPEPIFPMSRGRCCDVCNATVVIPYRLGGMNFRFGEDFEAQTTRKHRYNLNRFNKTKRPNRTGTGVKRKFWQDLFAKAAEDMPDELDMVMAQLYEIEDKKNPTPEDLTNYQNLLTRYYEMVSFNAEQKTARVRTMSGKPVSETLRKLKQDKNLSAKDARNRKEIKAEYNDVKSVRLEKRNTDSYFTDDQPEYPTGNWVVEGENIYLITTYRPHPVGSNGAMDKLEPKRVVINARGEGLTEELAYEDYSNKAREMLSTRKESKAENMEVFEAVSSNHDTYMKILSQVIKNYDSYSASKDAQLINRYGLTTMKRFMKWAESIGYSTYYCFTDVARDWLEGAEISSDDMKDIKALLRNLTDEKAKYQLATKVAKENSDLARIYNWTTDSQHKDVISLDKWDEDQFVIDFLATEEETEYYYSQERLTLGSKNVSMILNLGDYEDEDDEATFFDELNPKSGKIPRNLPNTASLLDYLETNAEQFENMLYHNDGLRNFKILRDLYGWSFAIHPAQKYIYEENDEIYIEWQLKRAIPAKKRQQIKLDAQKQIREGRAKLLS
tara:strand:+ start:593 stop:3292 length:2700 start_codon:yes stop_codon:yes gene_type:complete